ncbi:MAG TPA: SMP-30/gluconolactonase/LRE family protein [Solirubrobacterales bacterium]|jgi:gluconolactonase
MAATAPPPTELVADPTVEVLATGFAYTEGPTWQQAEQRLLFHDIVEDIRYGWTAADGLTVVKQPTHKGNGMAVDVEGRLLVCEQTLNRVVRHELDGSITVLAAEYEGKELNSPNDLAVRSNGDVIFSDPAYGRIPVYGEDRPQQLDFQGVYRVRGDGGGLELLTKDQVQPNGLCFSPDEQRFYVDDCELGDIWAYEVAADGTLGDGSVLCEGIGVPCPWEDCINDTLPSGYLDGMKCDERGNIYVTALGGVLILSPAGEKLGLIELTEDLANFTWGGPENRDLFVCCRSFIGRVTMAVGPAYTGGVA